jgi:hypothetical protein
MSDVEEKIFKRISKFSPQIIEASDYQPSVYPEQVSPNLDFQPIMNQTFIVPLKQFKIKFQNFNDAISELGHFAAAV